MENNCLHVYLFDCNYDEGECWAIVTAPSVKIAEKVFYSQTRFHSAKINTVQEIGLPGANMMINCEGTNREVFNRYVSILQAEFAGSLKSLKEELKGKQGEKGDKGDKGDPGTPADTTQFPTRTELESAISTLRTALATVATSGSYSDLIGKPTIPTKTSDLNNDSLPSMETLASYLTIESFQDQMSDILGLSAEGIQELVRILNDEDTTTGILEEIAGKATKTEVENAKVEALKVLCPWFDGIEDDLDEDYGIVNEYPSDDFYRLRDIGVIYDSGSEAFYLKDRDDENYYSRWKAFGIYADCHAYNDYSGGEATALFGLFYNSIEERVFVRDANDGFFVLLPDAQADWNESNVDSRVYIKNKPDLNAIYPSILPITTLVSTSPSNVKTTNGGAANEIVYSTNTRQVYNKIGSYLYTQWNGKVVSNIYYPSHTAYRTTTNNTSGAAKTNVWLYPIGTTYVYRNNIKYDLAELNNIPAAPAQLDFLFNSALLKTVGVLQSGSKYLVYPMHYMFIDLEEDAVTGDIELDLSWVFDSHTSGDDAQSYCFDETDAPEAVVELYTHPSCNTRVSMVDADGNPVKWITPAIGVLDADSYYLISIVDGTAGIIKLDERTYA